MLKQERWLLPEGVKETLSNEALMIEHHRRLILDMYHRCGYDLVQPPLVDFLDSLLTGTGHDLEMMTFTVTDQLSGKLLGIRADMTPQVSRIDAHYVKNDQPNRFCYLADILHTQVDGFSQSRCPIQAGAEIYGHAGFQSDVEIIRLMIKTLRLTGLTDIMIDLGHVAVFRHLVQQAGISGCDEEQLFDAVHKKATTDIVLQLEQLNLSAEQINQFVSLINLQGDEGVIQQAREIFKDESIQLYLDNLESIANALRKSEPDIALFFDLSELRGFNYHTGVVFSAYTSGYGQAVAQGGRYDGIGEKFGRPRAATGFSTDLAHLVSLKPIEQHLADRAIFAPFIESDKDYHVLADLEHKIEQLREQGERVVCELKGQHVDFTAMGCDRQLLWQNEQWNVCNL